MRRLAAIATVILLACSASGPQKSPGPEDSPLGDGKADSFINPSNMGSLAFGVSNRGSFSDTEQFLSWQFSLSDEASFSLTIDPEADNLDSVMYLYHRPDSSSSWGPYIKKNDDHDDHLWSRIDLEGQAGDYRVIIKPYKLAIRGSFTVLGDCSGSGCPSAAVCDEASSATLPSSSGFSSSCASAAVAALDSTVISTGEREIPAADRCNLEEAERTGLELYVDYWLQLGYPELLESEDPDEPTIFAITHVALANGTDIVSIDVMADEDNVSFVFDSAGELVLLYHSEQSSQTEWYCAEPGDEIGYFEDQFDPDCAGSLIWGMPRADEPTHRSGEKSLAQVLIDLDDNLGVTLAVQRFASAEGLEDDASVAYTLAGHQGAYGDTAHELALSAGDGEASFFISNQEIVFEDYRGEPQFLCEDPW